MPVWDEFSSICLTKEIGKLQWDSVLSSQHGVYETSDWIGRESVIFKWEWKRKVGFGKDKKLGFEREKRQNFEL